MAVAIPVTDFISRYVYNIVKHDFDIIPVMSGNPGISKTAQLHQLCEKCNWGLVPVHLALRPIESLSGLPQIKEYNGYKFTEWTVPEIVSKANELADKHERVILFFDDIHLADKSRQGYFFELATERSIAGHKLADNVKIICAGNKTAKAGKKTFLSAIVNRFTFVDVDLPTNQWLSWAMSKVNENKIKPYEVNKEKLETFRQFNIHPTIIGYIHKNESHLKSSEDTEPFASPRSWYFMSEWLKLFELLYGSPDEWNHTVFTHLTNIAAGTLGSAIAQEFITFIKYTSDVDFDKLLKEPELLLRIEDEVKRMAVYYQMMSKTLDKKYRKYAYKVFEFAYWVLGNNGRAPHFAIVLLKLNSDIMNINGERYNKLAKELNLKHTFKDFVDALTNISNLLSDL